MKVSERMLFLIITSGLNGVYDFKFCFFRVKFVHNHCRQIVLEKDTDPLLRFEFDSVQSDRKCRIKQDGQHLYNLPEQQMRSFFLRESEVGSYNTSTRCCPVPILPFSPIHSSHNERSLIDFIMSISLAHVYFS